MTVSTLMPLLNVEDVPRSLTFYREALGFEVIQEAEIDGVTIWACIGSGEAKLMLNQPDSADSGARAARPSYSDVVLYLTVEDAHERHGALAARGLAIGPVERQAYGVDEFLLRDPDGYELAICSPIND